MACGSDRMVRMRPAASPFVIAVEQFDSNVLEVVCGARIRIRRRSASDEMLTRVEEGCCGEVIMVAIIFRLYLCARDVFWTRERSAVDVF